jgi:hypothetical protein
MGFRDPSVVFRVSRRVKPQPALAQLDRFIDALPRAVSEDETQFERSVLDWVGELQPDDRRALLEGLNTWLTSAEFAHRLPLAILIGAALRERPLTDRAIAMALQPPSEWDVARLSVLRLALVDAASRFPDRNLTAYLETLANGLNRATTYQEQNAAARASIVLCFHGARGEFETCVAPVVAFLRDRPMSPLDEITAFASLLTRRRR